MLSRDTFSVSNKAIKREKLSDGINPSQSPLEKEQVALDFSRAALVPYSTENRSTQLVKLESCHVNDNVKQIYLKQRQILITKTAK